MKAVDTGRAIAAPVGDGCLGRIFNVLGETVDNDDTKVPASDYWPIHRPAPVSYTHLDVYKRQTYAGFFAKSQIMFFLSSSFRFCPPLKNDGRVVFALP